MTEEFYATKGPDGKIIQVAKYERDLCNPDRMWDVVPVRVVEIEEDQLRKPRVK